MLAVEGVARKNKRGLAFLIASRCLGERPTMELKSIDLENDAAQR